MRTLTRVGIAGAVLLSPALALAHPGHDAVAGGAAVSFAAGMLHPPTGLDHLAAMVVLGVWSAMTARRVWLAPVVFVALLFLGAMLGMAGVQVPAIEPMIAVSLLALGLLTATQARVPAGVAAAIAAFFALFHGAAHGGELPAGASAAFYVAGFLLATAALHAIGIAAGLGLQRFQIWVTRVVGAAVAVFGAALLAA